MILSVERFRHYIDRFNAHDTERVMQYIPNASAWEWLADRIPLFECPDPDIEEIYYFRWWTFRKHIKATLDGLVITEFLPVVPWAGKHNTVVCAAGHHIYEGRWLRDRACIRDYALFWFRKGGSRRAYSTWLADGIYRYGCVSGDLDIGVELLPDLVANYEGWEASNQHTSGLFWSHDDRDGGEYSISGDGLRPTLNSYMYGDAVAIAALAGLAGRDDIAERFWRKAAELKALAQERLWEPTACFFKTFPLVAREAPVTDWSFPNVDPARNVREIYGYLPWYFTLPDAGYEAAWRELTSPHGFHAPYGPTTAEQRHPRFMQYRVKACQWDGASWPFTTTQALVALANLLHHYEQDVISPADYVETLRIYARSQHLTLPYGERVPWIDEDIHPFTGVWLARELLACSNWPLEKGGFQRGKDYNHSGFCDPVISGLLGLQPQADDTVVVHPLVPEGTWDWFCLDHVHYHGRSLAIFYDRTGERYGRGSGLRLLVDGLERASAPGLQRISAALR